MNGSDLIAIERHRQMSEEGYDADHDRGHADELAHAAAAYALADEWSNSAPPQWPWSPVYWKPTPDDRVRELVKAGALIAAAIDSLLSQPHSAEGGRDAAIAALAEAIDLGDLGTRIAPKALEWLEANGWSLARAASEDPDEPCGRCGTWRRFHGQGEIQGPEYSRDHPWTHRD